MVTQTAAATVTTSKWHQPQPQLAAEEARQQPKAPEPT